MKTGQAVQILPWKKKTIFLEKDSSLGSVARYHPTNLVPT
jgi:hypothetical protein